MNSKCSNLYLNFDSAKSIENYRKHTCKKGSVQVRIDYKLGEKSIETMTTSEKHKKALSQSLENAYTSAKDTITELSEDYTYNIAAQLLKKIGGGIVPVPPSLQYLINDIAHSITDQLRVIPLLDVTVFGTTDKLINIFATWCDTHLNKLVTPLSDKVGINRYNKLVAKNLLVKQIKSKCFENIGKMYIHTGAEK